MNSLTTVFIFIIIFAILVFSQGIKKEHPEYKYIDLPEEFNQIQSGDTIMMYNIGDTTYLRFIPRGTVYNNITIVKI